MRNREVILAFLEGKDAKTPLRKIINGYYEYKGRTLYTNNGILYNYSTEIAFIGVDGDLYVNVSKYSATTSKIQSLIKRLAYEKGFTIIDYLKD